VLSFCVWPRFLVGMCTCLFQRSFSRLIALIANVNPSLT
jgi:hypothetical protein